MSKSKIQAHVTIAGSEIRQTTAREYEREAEGEAMGIAPETPRVILPGGQSVQTHCPIWHDKNVLRKSFEGRGLGLETPMD